MELHVSNLSSRITKDHLYEIFSTYGTVGSITLNQSVKTKKFYAYIELKSGADEVLLHLDEGIIDGKVIRVSIKTNQSNDKKVRDDNIHNMKDRRDRRNINMRDGYDSKRGSKYPPIDRRDDSRVRDRRYRAYSNDRRRNRDSRDDSRDNRDSRRYNRRGRSNSRDNYTRYRSRSRSDSRQRRRNKSFSPSSVSRSHSPSLVINRGKSFSRSRSRSPHNDAAKQREIIQNLINIQNDK